MLKIPIVNKRVQSDGKMHVLSDKINTFIDNHRRKCIAFGLILPWIIFSLIALKFPNFFERFLNSDDADGYIAWTLYSIKKIITL